MPEIPQQNCSRAGFGHALQLGRKPALLLVDFVQAYFLKDSALYAGVEATRVAARILLEAARKTGIPIVHTCVEYERGGRNGGVFFEKLPLLRCFEKGVSPELAAFAPGLEPVDGESLIVKQYASAFFGTSLASQLTALRIDTVLIAGLSTSGCVRASAVDCCQHGFIPVVVREAVGDRAPGPHEANLFDLQSKYAEVTDLAAVLEYLGTLQVASSAGQESASG